MTYKIITLLGMSAVCGFCAGQITSRPFAQHDDPPQESERVVVLVARKNLEGGETINDPKDYFVEKAVAKGTETEKAITTLDYLGGRTVKNILREGSILRTSDLYAYQKLWRHFGPMPHGYRVFGLRVEEGIAFKDSIFPQSRVDIITTRDEQVLVRDVLVLDVEHWEVLRQEAPNDIPGDVVTLRLKKEDMLTVTCAKKLRQLTIRRTTKSTNGTKD